MEKSSFQLGDGFLFLCTAGTKLLTVVSRAISVSVNSKVITSYVLCQHCNRIYSAIIHLLVALIARA